mgnify:CR=1 FL=1
MKKIRKSLMLFAFAATAICGLGFVSSNSFVEEVNGSAPADYYSACEGLTGSSLQSKLLEINKPKSKSYDWSRYEAADEALDDSSSILCIYTRHNIPKGNHCGNYAWDKWNREHIWTQSKYPNSDTDNHNIFACEGQINNYRSNSPFGTVAHTSANQKDIFGHKTDCYWTSSLFEPCDEAKGEVARSVMYGTVMYSYNMTEEIESIATALRWHLEHPITERDTKRNDVVYGLQGNRNPFVDHRSYACKIWGTSGTAKQICDEYNGWVDDDEPITTKILDKIVVSGTLIKTSYIAGEKFSAEGLTVTATYDDESTENVTSKVTVSPSPLTEGTTSVTLSYTYGDVTKYATVSGITVSEAAPTNYGTLAYPISVSDAKALIGKECTANGTYTKQQIYCRAKVGSTITDNPDLYRKKIYVSDINSVSSTVIVESLNMSKDEYDLLESGDEIIFHAYGYNNNGTQQFKFKDSSNPTLDKNVTKDSVVPVTNVSVINSKTEYFIGDSTKIETVVSPSNATEKSLTYLSNNTDVAIVDTYGNVTFIGSGSATITATSNNGKTGSVTFTVSKKPVYVEDIEAKLPSSSYYVGDEDKIIYVVHPEDADNPAVEFSSSDENVAVVDQSGNVEFLNPGSVTFTVTSKETSTLKDTIEVEVLSKPVAEIPVDSVTFDKCESNVEIGTTTQLFANVLPANATVKTLSYSTSDSDVATVSSTGLVTFKKVGTVTITATSNNDKTATATFKVSKPIIPVESVFIEPFESNVKANTTVQLTAYVLPVNATDTALTYSTSNSDVATVDTTGLIIFKKAGTVTITATSINEKTSTAVFNVSDPIIPVESVVFDTFEPNVKVNTTAQLTAHVLPDNASDKTLSYSTSDSDVATVSSTGLVTFKKAGTVTITATSNNEKFALATFNVSDLFVPVESVNISLPKSTYSVGASATVSYEVLPSNATHKEVAFSSSDSTVATIDEETGEVNFLKNGEVNLIVTSCDDGEIHNSIKITVEDKPAPVNKLVEIAVESTPNKTMYSVGEVFDSTGLVVVANYLDGRVDNISHAVRIDNVDMSTEGTKTVVVRYGETFKTEFNIIVTDDVISEIKVTKYPLKTHYFESEEFNPLGLVVEAKFANKTVDVSDLVTFNYDFSDVAQVTIEYQGKTAEIFVTIETGTITNEHKAADFAYLVKNNVASLQVSNVTLHDWEVLEHYYNTLDEGAQKVLKELVTKYSGAVSAAEVLTDTLKECAEKYDEIYLAHKDQGFEDFMKRSPKAPNPTPTPDPKNDSNLPLILGIVGGVVGLAVVITIIAVAASKKAKKKHA